MSEFHFTKYRTFFIVFGILVFFIIMFVQYWTKEEFSLYPENIYEQGGSVNINGKYMKENESYKRYNAYGPLAKLFGSSFKTCDAKCKSQDECNPIRGNKCESSFNRRLKTCYCSFRKNEVIGMNDTAAKLMTLASSLPNEAKPCWVYPKTKSNVYTQLDGPQEKYSFRELNISDSNRLSISFWIYLDDSLVIENNVGLVKMVMNNKNIFKFSIKGKNLVLKSLRDKSDITIPIGTTVDSSWIAITFNQGVQNIYLNGALFNSSIASAPFGPLYNNSALYLKTRTRAYLKNFKFYDHTISESVIGMLYKGV